MRSNMGGSFLEKSREGYPDPLNPTWERWYAAAGLP